ncbi:hypothetical protein [Nostoc sp. C110]|uniref:hypothetical protein n=1 Tax=Nostoc sp. C110 TaxID=3349876 RepID=UPI00370DAC3F
MVLDTTGFSAANSSVIGPSIKNTYSTYSALGEGLVAFLGAFSDFLVLAIFITGI